MASEKDIHSPVSPTGCKPILYSSYNSDSCWRVRIALAWKGVDYELRYEPFPKEFADMNSTGMLPYFVTKSGKMLTQSIAIIEYLEATYPERPMFPKSPVCRAEAMGIALNIACDIEPFQIKKVLKLINADAKETEEFASKIISKGFESLEKRLDVLSGTYCLGDKISIADFCLVPMVYAAKRHGVDMKPFPCITRIRNTLMTLPEFKDTHPHYQPDCPSERKGMIVE